MSWAALYMIVGVAYASTVRKPWDDSFVFWVTTVAWPVLAAIKAASAAGRMVTRWRY